VLSPQARAIAHLHPGVLAELSDAEALSSEARERLESAAVTFKRVQHRAYGARQQERYADLRHGLSELATALALLQRTEWFLPQAQFETWQQTEVVAPEDDRGR